MSPKTQHADTLELEAQNAAALELELKWLAIVITVAIRAHFGSNEKSGDEGAETGENQGVDVRDIVPPVLPESSYKTFIDDQEITLEERLVLILSIAPYVRPDILDLFLLRHKTLDRGFTAFGGLSRPDHGGFWPTVETASFLLSQRKLESRFEVQGMFEPQHFFSTKKVLATGVNDALYSIFNRPLELNPEYLYLFTTGRKFQPAFGSSFPAKKLTTLKEWDDLVLAPQALRDVEEVKAWLDHRGTLLNDWQLHRRINPGFRILFHGPPGTGKTLTATLLGKETGLPIYRVDLSLVVSKWIGETEKNLSNIFDQAESNDWILFFDEADALFGKRTQTASANDRYANQEVSYLLQRIEDFPGVVVLATNLKGNIDEAFARRFQSMIYFAEPKPEERRKLWKQLFAPPIQLEANVDLDSLANEYELTGGSIVNVLRFASLMALRQKTDRIQLADLREGVRRELTKSGRVA